MVLNLTLQLFGPEGLEIFVLSEQIGEAGGSKKLQSRVKNSSYEKTLNLD